jgi:hypothetical protein
MTGEIRVSFAPGGPNPADDPSIQFSTGGRSASFTIPANSTHAVFSSPQFAIQVGSVAGTLSFSINSLMAGSTPYVPPGGSTFTAQIDAAAPAIRTVNVTRSQGGFQVRVVAVSSTRDLAQASVRLQSGGANPQTGVFAIPLESAAKTWFQSQTSALYGGQFTLTLPFTFTGPEVSLSTVSVTLSNSAGNSLEASAPY